MMKKQNKKDTRKQFEGIVDVLEKNLLQLEGEYKKYSSWYSWPMRYNLKRRIRKKLIEVRYYKELIKKYEKEGLI